MKNQHGVYERATWEVPAHSVLELAPKKAEYCLVIPVLNEGERIARVLEKTQSFTDKVDIIIVDKGSTDGSLEESKLKARNVRTLLRLEEDGALSSQLRVGYAYGLEQGYRGIVTIDGNDKDDVPALPNFLELLSQGYDFVQASRYIPGGKGVNTPIVRDLAIKILHAPIISLLAGFRYTDTTQGYRAYSRDLLLDPDIAIFRSVFSRYELLAYLSVKAPRHGYRVIETPVTRTYPKGKKVPTKISFIKGNADLLCVLWDLAVKKYDPKQE